MPEDATIRIDDTVEIDLDAWPNCIVPDCPNKINLGVSGRYCWPHSYGLTLNEAATAYPEESA